MTPRRTTLAALTLLLLVACSPPGGQPTRPPPHESTPAASPVAVLQAWDERRSEAWASGDVAALRRLYVAGSVAGERDVAMLRRWRSRGLTVAELEVQSLAGRVLAQAPGQVTVEVTERLARAAAVGGAKRWALPAGTVATRHVTLRRVGGEWRVAQVVRVPASGLR